MKSTFLFLNGDQAMTLSCGEWFFLGVAAAFVMLWFFAMIPEKLEPPEGR